MFEGFSFEAVLSGIRRNLFLSGLTVTGILLLFLGFFSTGFFQPPDTSVVYEATTQDTKTDAEMTPHDVPGTIMVDVSGAVMKPGVYELPVDARVQDALSKAGGLASKADHQAVAQAINLAAKITDGRKLYFPFIGEKSVLGSTNENTPDLDSLATGTSPAQGLININSDSQSDLESLPGIGEVTAMKIIKGRPYTSVQELKDKKVVGESVYDKIKELITAN